MTSRIGTLFSRLLSEDINKQARRVELIALLVFVILGLFVWWLWQFQLNVSLVNAEGQPVTQQLNIFELLIMKR
ncbi:MAG: hypothetical protein JW782_04830 [Candidatus Saganbacteria bacterium]|nr:hypothetical protein [Candidatus Saganbacteria bacterium]